MGLATPWFVSCAIRYCGCLVFIIIVLENNTILLISFIFEDYNRHNRYMVHLWFDI